MCRARRISGSASTQAVGGLEQLRQVVEADGDVWGDRAEGTLVDVPGPGASGLGLGQAVGGLEQLRQVVEAVATLG